MKKLLLLTLVISLCKASSAQITKHNWLVGGTVLFSSLDNKSYATAAYHETQIDVSPNIGYFFANKFAAGIKLSYTNTRYKTESTISKFIDNEIGPFIRYYFLPANKSFNLLVDANYQYGIEKAGGSDTGNDFGLTKYNKSIFSIAAGPVLYFNSSVGLEFLFGYSTLHYNGNDGNNNTFQTGLGLQVHLKK